MRYIHILSTYCPYIHAILITCCIIHQYVGLSEFFRLKEQRQLPPPHTRGFYVHR